MCGLAEEDGLDFVEHLAGFEGFLEHDIVDKDLRKDLVTSAVLHDREAFFTLFFFVQVIEKFVFPFEDLSIDIIFLADLLVGEAFDVLAKLAHVFLSEGLAGADVIFP